MKRLTNEIQNEYCFTLGPFNNPNLEVEDGETVVVDTEDAICGQIRKIGDKRDYKKAHYTNPMSAPIYGNYAVE
ncbi:MAG: hypothetical protein ABSB40_07850 [Nitrososphaeria archaeon]|jgi:acetamidase/formamidase